MKTYKKTITTEKPLLEINYEQDAESPREWSNVGYFFTTERGYQSPDGKNHELYGIMIEAGYTSNNSKEHAENIKKLGKKRGYDVLEVYPIHRYEHSGVSYRVGVGGGFDDSNCGFYIITKETAKEVGVKENDFLKAIESELETYNKWANGEVYGFTLFDKNGDVADSCWGFYNIQDIREYLPKGWKNEDLEDYFKN